MKTGVKALFTLLILFSLCSPIFATINSGDRFTLSFRNSGSVKIQSFEILDKDKQNRISSVNIFSGMGNAPEDSTIEEGTDVFSIAITTNQTDILLYDFEISPLKSPSLGLETYYIPFQIKFTSDNIQNSNETYQNGTNTQIRNSAVSIDPIAVMDNTTGIKTIYIMAHISFAATNVTLAPIGQYVSTITITQESN